MHAGRAAVRSEFLYCIAVAIVVRKPRGELAECVTHAMGLRLPNHMARNPTRILNVLVPMKDLPDRSRLGTDRIPHMRGKDQRVPARVVVKHDLGGRVRQNAPVPVDVAVDTYRRKRRRQSARSKNMSYRNLSYPAVNRAHLA